MLSHAILKICIVAIINLALSSAGPQSAVKFTGKYGPWKEVSSCSRPVTGPCSKENTCCNEVKGVRTLVRDCKGPGPCKPHFRQDMTKPCKVRCSFTGKYGSWKAVGSCSRPATGPCSRPNTCCERRGGVKTFVRTCKGPGACNPKFLPKKTTKCKIPCDKAEWGAWVAGDCIGTCGTGVLTYKRECKDGYGTCSGDAERTEVCTLTPCPEFCFDVITWSDDYPEEMSWNITCADQDCGSCSQNNFDSMEGHTHTCCLHPLGSGDVNLDIHCLDSGGDGWYYYKAYEYWEYYHENYPEYISWKGHLTIDGVDYCDNFESSHHETMTITRDAADE